MAKKASNQSNSTFNIPAEPIVPTTPAPQAPQLTIEQAMKMAEHHQQSGNLQEAEKITRTILNANPKFAPALHLLGVIAHAVGKIDMAIDLIEQAIAINNKNELFFANIAEMYRRQDRFEEAVEMGKKAVELNPDFLFAQSNLGIAYFDLKEFDLAEKHQDIALKLQPNFAPSLNNKGSILRNRDHDYNGAEEYFKQAISADPNFLDAHNNLGEVLTRLEDPDEALKVLDSVLKKDPNHESAWCNRGLALLALGNGEESKNSYLRAHAINNECVSAFAGLVMVALEFNRYELGIEAAEKLIATASDEPDSYAMFASVLLAQGKTEEAEAQYQKALSLDSEHIPSKVGMGNIYVERGSLKAAEEIFTECLGKDAEQSTSALYSLMQAKKIKPGMPEIALMEEEAKKLEGKLIDSKAISLNFALGKMYDDLGEYEKGFPYYIEGCRIKRKVFNYSQKQKEQHIERIKQVFTKDFIEENSGHGNDSKVPIFVLGMPRSGTTLTEQIIASHPSAFGAGELKDLIDLIKEYAPEDEGEAFADRFVGVEPATLKHMGDTYLSQLLERSPDSPHITDKMPANFHYVGLIKMILPNAKIVHVNRHPLDNCISCFTRQFAHGQGFSYDLEEVGHYYRCYSGLMDHWRQVLPEGSFYDLQYERLVDDTEAEAKALINYCGLEWNESCLEFYKHKRSIRTASVTQVRQPIYKTSKQRWKNYDKFLDPMKKGLGDILDKYPS